MFAAYTRRVSSSEPPPGHPSALRGVWLLILALILSVDVATASQGPTPDPGTTRAIRGVVRDQTGLVLPGASVLLLPARVEAITDAEGRFHFDAVPVGQHRVRCEMPGFGGNESAVEVTAQTDSTIDLTLSATFAEDVVVTGTRTRVALAEVPVRTEVVPTRAIAQTVPRNLADTLAFTPGVRVENDCQNCNFSQVRLLGLDGAYTQILMDGQPVVGSLAAVYGVEQIPARLIERVEIVKGGGSALYGSGSVGGVVNVIQREPSNSGGSFTTHVDVADGVPRYTAGGVADWVDRGSGTFLTAFAQTDRGDEIDLTGDGFSEIGRRRMAAGGARAAKYFFGGKAKLTGDGYLMHEYRRGGDQLDKPEPEVMIAERVTSNSRNGNASWFHSVSPRLDYRVTASVSHTARDTYYGAGMDPNAFGDSSSFVTVLDAQVNHYLPGHVLTWGAQGSREHLIDRQPAYNREIDEEYQSGGVFLQDAWTPTKGWQVVTGLRADRPNTLDSVGVSPRIAIMWAPRADLTMRVSAATGFRAPQVFDEDLHINSVNGVSYLISNASGLERETSLSVTAGLDWKPALFGGTGLVEVNTFHTRLDNLFAVQEADNPLTDEFEFLRVNAKGGKVYGIEANIGWGHGDDFVAQVGMVEQRAEYDEAEPDFGSLRFFRTPERSFIGLVTWRTRLGDLFAAARYTGAMYAPHYAGYIAEDRLEKTRTFFEIDLSYAKQLTTTRPLVKLLVTGKNLTNVYQDDIDQGPLRDSGYVYGPRFPRAIGVGLQCEF